MIGIIVAMEEELKAIMEYANVINKEKKYNTVFTICTLNNKKIVLVKCGVGKVNASRITQLLIDSYNIDYIINTGVAGGLYDSNVLDIVIAEKLVQHDFDITVFSHEKGYITEIGKYISADKGLIKRAKQIDKNIKIGVIATGDQFITNYQLSKIIEKKFNAIAVEMEGAAVAQVCMLCKVPFIIIRSISDNPNNKNHLDYEKFLSAATTKVGLFIKNFI